MGTPLAQSQSLFARSVVAWMLLGLWTGACSKDSFGNFPNVGINKSYVLAEPSNFPLTVQGGWIVDDGGVRGLIVYRKSFTNQVNDFNCYDRGCTLHYELNCGQLSVVNDIFLECGCDQARWIMLDGSPNGGNPAPPLRAYQTEFLGGVVVVRN
ncbi:hypothetical protein GC167_02505 [bacterium]|nr:hypothetical protein [bacterium]